MTINAKTEPLMVVKSIDMAAMILYADGVRVGICEDVILEPHPKNPFFGQWSHTITGYVKTYYYDKLFFGNIMGTLTKKQQLKYRLMKVIKTKRKGRK